MGLRPILILQGCKYLEKYIQHIRENEEHKELLQQANEVYNNINKLKLCFGF
jgi:hypothetical protein